MADNKGKRSFYDYLLDNGSSDDEDSVQKSECGSNDHEDDSLNDDTYSKDHSSIHLYPFVIYHLYFNFEVFCSLHRFLVSYKKRNPKFIIYLLFF